jgi:hypothetical protein
MHTTHLESNERQRRLRKALVAGAWQVGLVVGLGVLAQYATTLLFNLAFP